MWFCSDEARAEGRVLRAEEARKRPTKFASSWTCFGAESALRMLALQPSALSPQPSAPPP